MALTEQLLFATPVWLVENAIADSDLDKMISFAREAVQRWPLAKPVSKRNGSNSQPISFRQPDLMAVISESLAEVNASYQPNTQLTLKHYWININPPGSYNIRHTHPRSVLTCTLYLTTPQGCGDLVLHNMNPAQTYAAYSFKDASYNHSEWRITPRPGLFVALPGWLDHSVDINNSISDRISISMNIVAKQ
jgi:Putative 2OG-Fe(II) oxygenase